MASRFHIAAAVLLTLALVAVLSSAQDYPPQGRPGGGAGRDCYYVCFLDSCTRRKCYYTCNRPRYCEEEHASLLLSSGGGEEDGLGQLPSPGSDTVDSADEPSSVPEPAATPTA
ncbi:uncharacterized protein LOC144100201 [Amblyomma americanum]